MSNDHDRPDQALPENEAFQPMDVGQLETFENEVSGKTPGTPPDYDRFKLLFDPAELDTGEKITFEALKTVADDLPEEVFEPLIKGAGTRKAAPAPEAAPPADPSAPAPEAVDEKSPEEIGFEQGFEKGRIQGLDQGRTEGQAQGREEGFAQGQAQGIEEGKAKGYEQGLEQGHQQGRAQGLEEAQTEVAAQASEILGALKESLETADQLLDRMLVRYEGQLIELVHKIAQKAVGAVVATDDEVVRHTIMEALKSLVAPEEITLNVSTEDYEYVEMVKESFFESMGALNHIAVNSDPMIPKGGCRIESAGAVISTDPESKLAAVYDAIVEASRS